MHRWFSVAASVVVLTSARSIALSAPDPIWPVPTNPVLINVSADSQKGWLPSQEDNARVHAALAAYFRAQDEGRAADAYASLTVENRRLQPLNNYSSSLQKFNAETGPVRERTVLQLTWTKDPPAAPAPGVYASVDLMSSFVGIDRDCGYIVLYRAPGGDAFQVAREESNLITNTTAKTLVQTHSEAYLEKTWEDLSSRCPNYKPPLTESSAQTIGYPTVAAAIAALKAKPSVVFSIDAGWTVASDSSDMSVWSFPPVGHSSYPSAVKRRVASKGAGSEIVMSVLCESTKTACDDLVRQFNDLNNRVGGGRP
jgi:hypothetical protein